MGVVFGRLDVISLIFGGFFLWLEKGFVYIAFWVRAVLFECGCRLFRYVFVLTAFIRFGGFVRVVVLVI